MTYRYRRLKLLAVATIGLVVSTQAQAAGADAEACRSPVPAAMGGPLLRDPGKIMLRWLSTSNYELVYRGQVFLLDAYFERGPRNRPTGIVPSEVKQTDAIFIGHAHFDHMSDAAPIAQKTKAKVVGAPITIETAYKLGLPEGQGTVVAGGETLKFRGSPWMRRWPSTPRSRATCLILSANSTTLTRDRRRRNRSRPRRPS
jgi:Beta-lactamase superfamily domain